MTTQSKALGNGLENRVVTWARRFGLTAARQPGSGVFADFPNDVTIQLPDGETLLVECKVRSVPPSFAVLLGWLARVTANAKAAGYGAAILVFNQKGSRKPKVLLDLDTFLRLVTK